MISLLGLHNFMEEITGEERIVLVACLHREHRFGEQFDVLEKMATNCRQQAVKVCVVGDRFLDAFMRLFEIGGTPTFLIMENGKERDRLMGMADRETLKIFLSGTTEQRRRQYGTTRRQKGKESWEYSECRTCCHS